MKGFTPFMLMEELSLVEPLEIETFILCWGNYILEPVKYEKCQKFTKISKRPNHTTNSCH